MSKIALKKALLNVLRANKSTQDIAEEDDYVSNLLKRLMEQPTKHLKGFAEYLQQECAVSPQGIAALTEAIIANPDLMIFLKVKAYALWLQYQIYAGMEILQNIKGSETNKINRRKITDVFVELQYHDMTFTDFLKRCFVAIQLGQENLQDIASAILNNVPFNMKQIFKEEQFHEKPITNIEQQFKELITVYNNLPQSSFQKELMTQVILIHSQKHKEGLKIVNKELPQLRYRNYIQARKQKHLLGQQNQPQSQPQNDYILSKHIELLNFFKEELKKQSEENIVSNLKYINVTLDILKASKLGKKDRYTIEEFQRQFVQYFNRLNSSFQKIDLKLKNINESTPNQIKKHYIKIKSYVQIGSISLPVQQAINKIQEQLIKKLKNPFIEYNTSEVPLLKENKHYKHIINFINNFDKLSTFALGVCNIVSAQQYDIISEYERNIKQCLQPLCKDMESDIENFLILQFGHSIMPLYLKDLVNTLLTISRKNKACQYLTQKLNFSVHEKLNDIQNKLNQFKEKIIFAHKDSQNNAVELEILMIDCKQFGEIEDIYEYQGESQNKFGFWKLQCILQEEFFRIFQQHQQRCIKIIEGKKPTKILFNELQTYYAEFVNIKSADCAISRMTIIVSKLKQVGQKALKELEKSMEYSNDIDNILEAMTQVIYLQRNLNKLYSLEEDRAEIQVIQECIHRNGLKIIPVFERVYKNFKEDITNLNPKGINKQLKIFGQLEDMIYEIFNFKDEDIDIKEIKKTEQKQNPKNNLVGLEKVATFVRNNVSILREMIYSHSFIKEEAKISAKQTKNLKSLLEILKNGAKLQMSDKYENNGPNFVIDDKFEDFYSECNEHKRQKLRQNLDSYFNQLFEDKYNKNTGQYNQNARRIIEQKRRLLPLGLRHQYKEKKHPL